jgi:hypothetical protein
MDFIFRVPETYQHEGGHEFNHIPTETVLPSDGKFNHFPIKKSLLFSNAHRLML